MPGTGTDNDIICIFRVFGKQTAVSPEILDELDCLQFSAVTYDIMGYEYFLFPYPHPNNYISLTCFCQEKIRQRHSDIYLTFTENLLYNKIEINLYSHD